MLKGDPAKLSLRDLRISFALTRAGPPLNVLDGIDLDVREGEIVSIVGPSGCGKSTLIAAIDGLIPIDAGEIRIDGSPVSRPGPDRAVVFQHDSLFPWRTVLRNIAYGLELQRRLSGAECLQRARALVDRVGLAGFADAYPGQLSGGMRQRVNIARALAVDPDILLLDEPFASLDAQTREFMQLELLRILAPAGKTALFVTHQIDEAIFLASRVVVLSGRPARVREIVTVDLPADRTLAVKRTPRFTEIFGHIWTLIEDESRKTGAVHAP